MPARRLPLAVALAALAAAPAVAETRITVGPRPLYLVDQLPDGELKETLLACADQPVRRTNFSIGHRGAPMQFPEHTVEGNTAAARMGAGILECDVTFTADEELVCRHAQNDLHTTTNILVTDLAGKCTQPFQPASGDTDATAECRTSDITLAEFRTLTAKMDASDPTATTPEGFLGGTADWRTDLYTQTATTLMTHAESIEHFRALGAKFTPELKSPAVEMPFNGFSQEDYAQKLVDEYKAADVPAEDVWLQSFNLDDVLYWIDNEPDFGAQAVYLVEYDTADGFDNMDPETWGVRFEDLKARGVNYLAPPLWVLVTPGDAGDMVPSAYAEAASEAGLTLISWSLERSGPLNEGGGWYYQSVADVTNSDGAMYEMVDTLAREVGVVGIFSDWPATVSYYASCMGLD